MRVDETGFHPRNITIKKGASVLWTWKDEPDQQHNIIHVNPPDSAVGLFHFLFHSLHFGAAKCSGY